MALSTIDRNTAPIVADLQKGIAALPAVHPIADVTCCPSSPGSRATT
jgi:hypothetical protein